MRSRVGLTMQSIRMKSAAAASIAGVLAAVMALSTVNTAFAQPKPKDPAGGGQTKPLTDKQKKDQAGKLFKDANDKFDKGDYAGAAAAYEEADTLFPGSKPKQRAALSYDKLGKVKEAVIWYEKFLADNPEADKFKNNEIPDAKARLEALKKTPSKVKVATDPPSPPNLKLMVDGAPQTGPELSITPGKHQLSASADGYDTVKQDIDVPFGETKDVTITLAKSAAPPPVAAVPPPAPPPTTSTPPPTQPDKPTEPPSKVPAYVTLGLAGVGVVVGTIFGIQALSAKSDFEDDPTTDNADTADRNALIADMSFAVALTFGVTGTVLLLSSGKAEEKPAAAARRGFVAPYVTPQGGGAAARFRF